MTLTHEEYAFCKSQHRLLQLAQSDVILGTDSESNKRMYDIYNRIFNTNKNPNTGCGTCRGEIYRKVGKIYLEDEKIHQRMANARNARNAKKTNDNGKTDER